jgi:hypothetical protein
MPMRMVDPRMKVHTFNLGVTIVIGTFQDLQQLAPVIYPVLVDVQYRVYVGE